MYYSVIVLPIAAAAAKKVVVKMNIDETVSDFLSQFEDAVYSNRKNYTFFILNESKSVLNDDVTQFGNQRKKMIEVGLTPTTTIYALEKIPIKQYFDLLSEKAPDYAFKDYYDSSKDLSTICKIVD